MPTLSARNRLARELAATLLVKAMLLWLLWFAFFRTPLDKTLNGETVGMHLLNPPAAQIKR